MKIISNIINYKRIITNLRVVYSKEVIKLVRKDILNVFYKISKLFRYNSNLKELTVLIDFYSKLLRFDLLNEISRILSYTFYNYYVLPLYIKVKTL